MLFTDTCDDWVTTNSLLNESWLKNILPHKDDSKIREWLQVLQSNEFESEEDLQSLSDTDWEQLPLPLSVRSKIKSSVRATAEAVAVTVQMQNLSSDLLDTSVAPSTVSTPLISQIDCVVVDISGSMKARSKLDDLKTREDVSKMLFHSLMDKIIALELNHAVGLLAFGQTFSTFDITTEYERIHDHLGRLDANQNRTILYDAIDVAADMINEFVAQNNDTVENADILKKRIFVLTDGQDNGSKLKPSDVARKLQEQGIILDAIPLATTGKTLQAMAIASGGLYFDVISEVQAMELFENDATLHVAYREEAAIVVPQIENSSVFNNFMNSLAGDTAAVTREIKAAVPASAYAKVMNKEEARRAVESGECKSKAGSSCTKRILKEYNDCIKNPIAGITVYMNADDITQWKVLMTDLPTPYQGGTWVMSIEFPSDYPFSALRLRFLTPVYHCNISHAGGVCLDILKDNWSPAQTASKTIQSIKSLMLQPNGDDPLDAFKGQLFRDDREQYMVEAQKHTRENASESFAKIIERYKLE